MTTPAPGRAGATRRRIVFVAANPSIDRLAEVDSIALGTIHRPDVVVALPGGKGLNAARAAVTLGGRVTAVAIVAGHAGRWIGGQLAALGVEADLVIDDGATETRTCLSVLDRSTGRLTEFYEPGEPLSSGTWAAFEGAIARQLATGDVAAIVCSGSLPPGAPSDGYARIARIAQAAPDGPLELIVDAHGTALEAVLAEHPAVVKLNATEAREATGGAGADLAGSTADAVRVGRALQARGVSRVIVTLGEDGAIACDGAAAWRLTASAGRGAYPVGSGDAFVAGLAVALADGISFLDAARAGMAAGIANAFEVGAGAIDPTLAATVLGEVVATPL